MTFLRLFPEKERPKSGADRAEYIQNLKATVAERSKRAERRAFRVRVPEMTVWVKELGGKEFPIRDLSVLGIGFVHGGTKFEPGMTLTLSMHEEGKPLLLGVVARVVRCDADVSGCEFVGLEGFQENFLSKIVLEKQKRQVHSVRKNAIKRAVM